jgi:DNA gyrase inhibitor GyrI
MAIEIDKRTRWIGGGVVVAAAAGAAAWWLTRVETPPYTLVLKDGAIEVRAYGALKVAATRTAGLRQQALEQGFRTLADYIFANSRTGERVAMTAPVLSDDQDGDWRTRFILPARYDDIDPPAPPEGVTIGTVPARRVAAIRFSGRADDAMLADKETELRDWLGTYGLKATGPAEHAFYNPPIVPGPLRHNEVLLPVASIY